MEFGNISDLRGYEVLKYPNSHNFNEKSGFLAPSTSNWVFSVPKLTKQIAIVTFN